MLYLPRTAGTEVVLSYWLFALWEGILGGEWTEDMEAQAEGYENSTSRDHGGVGENGQAVERLPSPFKPSFKFIVNSSSPAQARLTVRKHVMREYRRRERWEQSSKAKPLGPKSPSSKGRNKKVEPEVKERSRSNEGQTLYADAAAYEARNEEIGSSQLTNAKRPRAMGPGVELDSIESFGSTSNDTHNSALGLERGKADLVVCSGSLGSHCSFKSRSVLESICRLWTSGASRLAPL